LPETPIIDIAKRKYKTITIEITKIIIFLRFFFSSGPLRVSAIIGMAD